MVQPLKHPPELHPDGEMKKPSADSGSPKKDKVKRVTEREIDETLEDSFPASDPPGGY